MVVGRAATPPSAMEGEAWFPRPSSGSKVGGCWSTVRGTEFPGASKAMKSRVGRAQMENIEFKDPVRWVEGAIIIDGRGAVFSVCLVLQGGSAPF